MAKQQNNIPKNNFFSNRSFFKNRYCSAPYFTQITEKLAFGILIIDFKTEINYNYS